MTEEAIYKKEKTGWGSVNSELRKHGLQVVEFLSPTKALQTADVVHMEVAMSRRLQESLSSLMRDCDRRQALVQDLILTNSQLKKDLEKQQTQLYNSEAKVRDLKIMLDSAKDKIQDLEYENINNTSYLKEEEDKLHNTKQVIHQKYNRLKIRCTEQQEEIELLQQRLNALHAENEKRMARQHEAFSKFKKKGPRSHTVGEDRVMDIIDTYESEIYQLKNELDTYRKEAYQPHTSSPGTRKAHTYEDNDSTPNFKALIKSYERQLREGKQTIKQLEDEAEMRKLELQARPELKDFRAAQQRIKNLEALMRRHRISDRDANVTREKRDPALKYSTLIEDLEFLPVTYTRKYLRQVSEETGVYDLDDLVPKVQTMARFTEAFPKLEQFSKQVLQLVSEEGLPQPSGLPQRPAHKRSHTVWCERTANHMLTVLTYWQQQMLALPDLRESLNQLVSALMPWRDRKLSGHYDVGKLTDVVDSLVYDEEMGEKKDNKGQPSLVVMSGIVEHFQQLFDVPNISGVYPMMNDIYTRLGEAQNVLHTLRDLLGLDEKSKSSAVVEAVGRVCQQHNIATTEQLQELFAVDSLDQVVQKLHEHEEFLPVFQEVVEQLFTVLNVDQLDQVVPAVQALKVLATVNS